MTKKTRYFWLIKILFIVAMIVAGIYFYHLLPAQIPVHRNAQGIADGFGSKLTTLIGLPALAVVLIILFYFLPKRDPRKENYASFATPWEILQLVILGFFTYIYFVTLSVVLHPSIAIMPLLLGGIGVLFVVLGAAMRYIKSNYFVGIRTPWTIESEVVRNKTHKVGSWTFMMAGILFVLNAFWSQYFTPIFVITIALCILIPIVYSYVIYKKLK